MRINRLFLLIMRNLEKGALFAGYAYSRYAFE